MNLTVSDTVRYNLIDEDTVQVNGGVSARTLDRGSPDDVRCEVEECIDLGKNGGLILAPGHALKYPKDNIEAMHKTWLEKGWFIRKGC